MREKQERKPTFQYFVRIGDAPYIDMDTMTPEERFEIGVRLNDQALRAIGYLPIDETALE